MGQILRYKARQAVSNDLTTDNLKRKVGLPGWILFRPIPTPPIAAAGIHYRRTAYRGAVQVRTSLISVTKRRVP